MIDLESENLGQLKLDDYFPENNPRCLEMGIMEGHFFLELKKECSLENKGMNKKWFLNLNDIFNELNTLENSMK